MVFDLACLAGDWYGIHAAVCHVLTALIGVIYGDIGTSPLYVYSSTFTGNPSYPDLLGAVSLIIWSLTLIVTVKYMLIVLQFNDEGEGGTFALYSLLARYVCSSNSMLAVLIA